MSLPRQSISLTPPNDEWLRSQVESQEYASKSEVVNDLIRKRREIDQVRAKLVAAELSGFTTETPEEILASFKARAMRDGRL